MWKLLTCCLCIGAFALVLYPGFSNLHCVCTASLDVPQAPPRQPYTYLLPSSVLLLRFIYLHLHLLYLTSLSPSHLVYLFVVFLGVARSDPRANAHGGLPHAARRRRRATPPAGRPCERRESLPKCERGLAVSALTPACDADGDDDRCSWLQVMTVQVTATAIATLTRIAHACARAYGRAMRAYARTSLRALMPSRCGAVGLKLHHCIVEVAKLLVADGL